MSYSLTFTIFTPTYNRANTLHRVYESLCTQTFPDFEWLIIDDGSTDGTERLVRVWQEEAKFVIRYKWQPNQGKHIAFNRAVCDAGGEFFLTFDSDDACVPTALERFYYHWRSIPANVRYKFSAVTALCSDQHGRLIGNEFPREIIDSDPLEIQYKYNVNGEKWGFHRTDVLRQFPFPEVPCFVPEGMVWSRIARKFKTRYVNEILRIYYANDVDTTNQLTRLGITPASSKGLVLWHESILNNEMDWIVYSPLRFIGSAVNYARFGFHCGRSVLDQLGKLRFSAKALYAFCLPVGLLLFLIDNNVSKT